MTIEPLSSAMTYQAQTIQPASQGKVTAVKPAVEYTEGTTQGNVPVIDKNTAIVPNANKKGDQGNNQPEQQSNEQVRKAVEQLNKKMQNSEAIFGIHDQTNRVTIKIVDKETKEVIKELPPEKPWI